MKHLALVFLGVVALLLVVTAHRSVDASDPGTLPAPLISCPNVDGSTEAPQTSEDPELLGGVRVTDIFRVVRAFYKDAPAGFPNQIDSDYVFLYDRNADGKLRVSDIADVVDAFFTTCPKADSQVALATQWVLVAHPELLQHDPDALLAAGYVAQFPIPIPGQGVHYARGSLWDGNFDPYEPEGLVYRFGMLAAQLYYVNGLSVGWQEDPQSATPGPCWDSADNGGDGLTDAADNDCVGTPSGPALEDVDIDPLCRPAYLPCTWSGDEGWHLHYRLCVIHAGTPNSVLVAVPDGEGEAYCAALHNGTEGGGTYQYADRHGWMGHLWNWMPNANRVPDNEYAAGATEDLSSGTPGSCTDGQDNGGDGAADSDDDDCRNGRFADCFPDPTSLGGPWKAYNCPQ